MIKVVFILMALFISLTAMAVDGEPSRPPNGFSSPEYYCPIPDVMVRGEPDDAEMKKIIFSADLGLLGEAFPRSTSNLTRRRPVISGFYIDGEVCSNSEFLCLKLTQHQRLPKRMDRKFSIFLPRKLEVNKEYQFENMKMVSDVASKTFSDGTEAHIPVVQVVIWQKINGSLTPIKLIVEEKRGITYWGGIEFYDESISRGAMCVLQSDTGLFSEVEIVPLRDKLRKNEPIAY